MRSTTVVLAVVFGVALSLFLQMGAWGQPKGATQGGAIEEEGGEAYAAARLVVTYEEGAPEATEEGAVAEVEGKVQEEVSPLDAEVVALPEVADERPGEARKRALEQARQSLESKPGVEEVSYDYLRKPTYTPNDADFPEQYGLERPRFPQAWGSDRGDDGDGVRIAVVDTGIDANHPDLRDKIAAQADFVDGDRVAQDDAEGHGTHVAGIAAAATNNGTGIAGGCPDCELLVARSLSSAGGGFDSDIVEGIVWAADNGAKVINLSFGGPQPAKVLKKSIDYAHRKGAVVVAAAGNTGGNTRDYPAAYRKVIAVTATDDRDGRAFFSNSGRYVDVAAPGVDILSTVPGGYASYSGTSQASPHVAALAGLLASEGKSNKEIRRSILSTAQDLGPDGRDPEYGAGRIDASRAVR